MSGQTADTRQEAGSFERYIPEPVPEHDRLGMRVAVTGWGPDRIRIGGDAWRALGSPARVYLSYNASTGELGIEAADGPGPGAYACCRTYDTVLVWLPGHLRRRYGLKPANGRYRAELRDGGMLVVRLADGPENRRKT